MLDIWSRPATWSSGTSARRNMFHIALRRRPAVVRALSPKTPKPSRIHRGWIWFGEMVLPGMAFTRGRDAADVIGVEDVGVLVRHELEVPVVDVAERRHVLRRGDEETDRVVGKGRGRSVRALGVVDELDLGDVLRRVTGGHGHVAVDALRDRRDVLGGALDARVVRDAEVRRLDLPPLELRVEGGRRGVWGRRRARG